MKAKRRLIWCYVPVIHEGYLSWFAEFPDADIAIVGHSDILDHRDLVKDIRRLDPYCVQAMLTRLMNVRVMTASSEEMLRLTQGYDVVVMPDEPLMHDLWTKLQASIPGEFWSAFLRWHKDNILLETKPHHANTAAEVGSPWTSICALASSSPDWWRQVACCVVREDEVLLTAYNHPRPSAETVFYQGDPRAVFTKGVHLELSSFIHAEASAIAQAARHGITLDGTDMYVTTFPCPPCAKLVAESGIKRLFFGEGYSVLDGNEVLESAGVEIIKFEQA